MRFTQMYNGICSAWGNVEHILFLSVSNRGAWSCCLYCRDWLRFARPSLVGNP